MPKENSQPPIRLVVSKDYFNKLVSLTDGRDDLIINNKNNSTLYDKLMTYTYLQDNEQVELRFFNQEASLVILLLLCNQNDCYTDKNYYEMLIQDREEYKKNKENESGV